MKKYSFVIYHKEYDKFLEQLRAIGLLHVKAKTSEEIGENAQLLNELNKTSDLIQEMTNRSASQSEEEEAIDTQMSPEELMVYIENIQERLTTSQHDLLQQRKDADFMEPWGNYAPETFKKLSEAGFTLAFYIADKSSFDVNQFNDKRIQVVNQSNKEYFLCVLNRNDEKLELNDADEVQLQMPLSFYEEQIKTSQETIEGLDIELNRISRYSLHILEEYRNHVQSKINFEVAYKSGQKYADDTVIGISGWVPQPEANNFEQKLKAHNVLFVEEPMGENDERPIKLKNNWFNRLYEPIGDLYTLPTHREFDLTPFFAPFYMLFFGFCLGDAGYGLLIMLISLWAVKKVKPQVKTLAWLGFSLGLSTAVMGIFTGTFFGIMFGVDADGKPLQAIEWLVNYQKEWVIDQNNLMYLAFGLGFLQVIVGMLVKAVRLAVFSGFKHALSQIGWIIIVAVALPIYLLGNQGMIEATVANKLFWVALVLGAIPALLYNSPGSNIIANFGTGLWDTYNMASGLLGDILSYVRLFALGLSSAILGNVFNSLAFELSPDIPVLGIIITILILLFGHGLNFALALLGSAVHPLRLTFVEFYKNAGFEGGGTRYSPFKQ
ncbi:MAG: V-type ATP synthase subunit I [Mangrovibacterium sp.]